jgi:hypothetical protein
LIIHRLQVTALLALLAAAIPAAAVELTTGDLRFSIHGYFDLEYACMSEMAMLGAAHGDDHESGRATAVGVHLQYTLDERYTVTGEYLHKGREDG